MRLCLSSRAVRPRAAVAIARVALVLSGFALVSCSLDVPRADSCASSDECRGLFGAGFYCESSGACAEVTTNPACAELFPAAAATDREAIVFGTILFRERPNQRARERAARLAVSGLNERGGLDGRMVALLHCDAADASAAGDYLVDEVGVAAIIGPSSSINTEAVFTAHSDTLVISPSATAVELTQADRATTPGLLWRTAPPDSLQTEVVLAELGDQSIGIVARSQDTYASSFSITIQDAATSSTLTVLEAVQFTDLEQIATAANNALTGGPTTVLFLSSEVADAARFLDEAAGIAGYDGVQILFPDAAANEELLTLTADSAGAARYPQVNATRPAAPDTVITSEFVAAYQALHQEDPRNFSFAAHAYDATAMVLLGAGAALGSSERLSGASIAEGIRRMTTTRGGAEQRLLSSNFITIIETLRTETPVDLVGASGDLDYDPRTEELTRASYDVLEIQGGAFSVLRTRLADPASDL